MLGGLHEAEEIGEMHDAGHVGLGKLHAADGLEFVRHIFPILG